MNDKLDLDSILTREQRKNIIEQQRQNWAANYYSQLISLEAVKVHNPDADTSMIESSMKELANALVYGKKKLAALEAEEAAEKEAEEAAARMFAEQIEQEAKR